MKKVANIVLNDFTNDSRVLKTSLSLKKLGFECVVLAMHKPGLELKESILGVSVRRIKLRTRPLPKWKPIQLGKYLEFLFKAFWLHRDVDVVHCNDLNALPIGILIKFFRNNVKVVYDCHEYETEVYGLKGVEKRAKKWLERSLIRYADRVITVSDAIACEYRRIYEIDKPHLVLNCPPYKKQEKLDLFRQNLDIRDEQIIFLYQGALNYGRGIDLILETFSSLESDKNVLVCMGYGVLEEHIKTKAKSSDRIFFHPAVSPEELLEYTGSADYGLSLIEDSCMNYRFCLPNKIFEYLMAGLPVVVSDLPEMRRLIVEENIGTVAKSQSIEGLKNAIHEALNLNYATIQHNAYQTSRKYCWEEQEKKLSNIYENI